MPASAAAQSQRQPFVVPAAAKVDRESVRTGSAGAAILMLRFRFNINIYLLYKLIGIMFRPNNKNKVIFWQDSGSPGIVRAIPRPGAVSIPNFLQSVSVKKF